MTKIVQYNLYCISLTLAKCISVLTLNSTKCFILLFLNLKSKFILCFYDVNTFIICFSFRLLLHHLLSCSQSPSCLCSSSPSSFAAFNLQAILFKKKGGSLYFRKLAIIPLCYEQAKVSVGEMKLSMVEILSLF